MLSVFHGNKILYHRQTALLPRKECLYSVDSNKGEILITCVPICTGLCEHIENELPWSTHITHRLIQRVAIPRQGLVTDRTLHIQRRSPLYHTIIYILYERTYSHTNKHILSTSNSPRNVHWVTKLFCLRQQLLYLWLSHLEHVSSRHVYVFDVFVLKTISLRVYYRTFNSLNAGNTL